VRLKSLQVFGLLAIAAAALQGQTYWSTDPNLDCSNSEGPFSITVSGVSGTVYACGNSGTFVWYAAGGPTNNPWLTFMRVAAPASGAVNVDYQFFDESGNPVSLDTTSGTSSTVSSGAEVNVSLNPNQPNQVNILGKAGTNHGSTADGTVYVEFLCPDDTTCSDVDAQLYYSALPFIPWSLSVPLSLDIFGGISTQWSGVGVDNGGSQRVSLVVYNNDFSLTTPTIFAVQVFDSNGNLAGSGNTPALNPIPTDSSGNPTGPDGGTYANLISTIIGAPLPSGPFKVLIDGGGIGFSAEMLQINGQSATTVAMAYDTSADLTAGLSAATLRQRRAAATAKMARRLAARHILVAAPAK